MWGAPASNAKKLQVSAYLMHARCLPFGPQATVSDGPGGTVYATARSLFIAPKPRA